MRDNPISATVDFEAEGVQHGFLKLPHSHDASAWGAIMIPVTVMKNGEGPTALLTGGNHGDEYEGPIALFEFARSADASQISGRLIIVPAMNYPAFRAGKRTSPIDSGNMNRVFPGSPTGTITEKIADYFSRTLLPMSDFVLDIHSGGKTLDFVPFAAIHVLEDKEQQARCEAAMAAFNAPYSMMLLELDPGGMYDAMAERLGKVFVSTELGGGGSATAKSVAIAKRGLHNFLIHAGTLAGELETGPSVKLDIPDEGCFVVSERTGLVEPVVDLGDKIQEGDLVARVHDVERSGGEAWEYRATRSGILAGRHFPGLVTMGDPLAVVGIPL